MANLKRITPFLWFDDQAEQAVELYTSIFPNSRVLKTTRYTKESAAMSKTRKEGMIMTIGFELAGQPFSAINGGPEDFRFNESISFVVDCETQADIDYFWDRLSAGGNPKAQQCGWLKDRFGVSWQIVPTELTQLLEDPEKAPRVTQAFLKMKKFDLAALRKAAAG